MKNFKKKLNVFTESRQVSRELQSVANSLLAINQIYNINSNIEAFIINAIHQINLAKTQNDIIGNKLFNELYNNIFNE